MKFRRGTVRRVAAIWLMLQMAWLTALIPRDCCAAHQPSVQEAGCHSSGPAAQCPMRAANGAPCPMHSGGVADHGSHHGSGGLDPQSSSSPAKCSLRGACAGPMAALLVLLANHGVLPHFTTAAPDPAVRSLAVVVAGSLAGHFVPPDPPPPRA